MIKILNFKMTDIKQNTKCECFSIGCENSSGYLEGYAMGMYAFSGNE